MPVARRTFWLSLFVIVAACAEGAGPLASPTAPAASPTASLVASPSPSPSPSPGPSGCPTTEPMSVSEYVTADPACFGSRDVNIAGWEDFVDGIGGEANFIEPSWLGEEPTEHAALVPHLPAFCDGTFCEPALMVHIDPASNLRFEEDGRWVVATGHRHDPTAEACRYAGPSASSSPTPDEVRRICRAAFVLTSVRTADPPTTEPLPCSTHARLTVAEFVSTDPACLLDREVEIVGWLDAPPAMGWEGPGIEPGWLVYPAASPISGFWSAIPVGQDHICPEEGCGWMFIHIDPRSGLSLGTKPRWVIVTGHISDPAADTCHYVYPADSNDIKPSDLGARRDCRSGFVLTSIRDTVAPPG